MQDTGASAWCNRFAIPGFRPSREYPDDASGTLPILVYSAHIHMESAAENENLQPTFRNIARALRVAFVVHGEMASDAKALGYPKDALPRVRLVNDRMNYSTEKNRCKAIDFITGNFPGALARTAMSCPASTRSLRLAAKR